MDTALPPVLTVRLRDPERLIEGVRGAELQPCQLSRGALPSELARVVFPRTCLDMVRFGPAMLFSGIMPRDCYTILFVATCPEPGRELNFQVEHYDGYIGFFAPGKPVDATTPAGYRNATLTVPAAEFHAGLARYFPEASDRLLADGAVMRVDPAAQRQLRAVLRVLWRMMWDPAQPLASTAVRRVVEGELVSAFSTALQNGNDHLLPPATPRIGGRLRRLRQARDYLAAHLHQPVYLEDLCASLGLSHRGAENLFRDFLGLSPNVFLQRQRLHAVRRALQQAEAAPGVVKRVALEHGFWHLGHFARDYRGLFGESPSRTLALEGSASKTRISRSYLDLVG